MTRRVYINLPVADLARSRTFFEALGFTFDQRFMDDTATAMVINETAVAMLLTHEKFRQFTPRPIADATAATEVLTCVQVESREDVDRIVETASANGGIEIRDAQDHGFMFGRSFADPDGHIWEIIWLDATKMPAA